MNGKTAKALRRASMQAREEANVAHAGQFYKDDWTSLDHRQRSERRRYYEDGGKLFVAAKSKRGAVGRGRMSTKVELLTRGQGLRRGKSWRSWGNFLERLASDRRRRAWKAKQEKAKPKPEKP